MDPYTHRAFELLIGSGFTRHRVENKRAVLILRACTNGEREEVKQMILAGRRSWLNWQTITQRQWQSTSPRHFRQRTVKAYAFRAGGIERAPARVQESIDTREKYVRCG